MYKINNIISLIAISVFIFFAVGSVDDSGSSSSSKKSRSSKSKKCQLAGWNRDGNGWRYYTGSDLGAYSYSCVRLGPNTGHSYSYTYCSKNHCIQDQ